MRREPVRIDSPIATIHRHASAKNPEPVPFARKIPTHFPAICFSRGKNSDTKQQQLGTSRSPCTKPLSRASFTNWRASGPPPWPRLCKGSDAIVSSPLIIQFPARAALPSLGSALLQHPRDRAVQGCRTHLSMPSVRVATSGMMAYRADRFGHRHQNVDGASGHGKRSSISLSRILTL